MKKRILSAALVLLLLLAVVPTTALADDAYEGVPSATVTLSLSRDDAYMVGDETGEVMVMKEITVPYFDLGLYGLEEYYFMSETYGDDGDGKPGSDLEPGTPEYANGKVTLLHLYIYALEVFHCGVEPAEAGKGYLYEEGLMDTDVFAIQGGVGSSFMTQFWGGDCNLNYYVNYVYPLASDGWGATSDQILLRDGDIVTLGNFTNWEFYSDPTSIFNYIKVGDQVGSVTVQQGDEVTLSLYCAGPNMGTSYDTAQKQITYCPDVYCCEVADASADVTEWEYIGYADENGELVFDTSSIEPGEYFICMPGQPGEYYAEICSTPGGIKLIVEGAESAEPEVVPGDVTGDGKVTVKDATEIYKMFKGLVTPTAEQKKAADINGDGKITVKDATEAYKIYKGL